MVLPKFIDLLVHLSSNELTSLRKFVLYKSSKDADIFRLYMYLHSHQAKLGSFTDIETLQETVLPTSTIKTVANYLSTLYQWSEVWVQMNQLEEDQYAGRLLELSWLNKRGLYNLANQTAKSMEKEIEEDKQYHVEKVFAKVRMLHLQYWSNNPITHEEGIAMLQDLIDTFSEYTKSTMLMYILEMENLGAIKNHDFNQSILSMEKSIKYLKDTPLTEIMNVAHKMFAQKDMNALLRLKDYLFENQIMQKSELHSQLIDFLRKSVIYHRTSGTNFDQQIAKDLINYILNAGALLGQGRVTILAFLNVVNQISVLESYEYVDRFIEAWHLKVHCKNPEANKALNMAINCIYHHRYDEVLALTWRSDFEIFNQKNMAQCMHTMAAFMNRKRDLKLYQNSMFNSKMFIKRNKSKMSERLFISYSNIFELMEKLDAGHEVDMSTMGQIIFRTWCEYIVEHKKWSV